MNYIVDPKLIYLLSIVDYLRFFASGTTAFLVVGLGVLITYTIYNYVESENPEYRTECRQWNRKWYQWCKRLLVFVAICTALFIALLIFMPSKNTLIGIEIAKAATYENVNFGIQQLKEAVDYVIDAIGKLK